MHIVYATPKARYVEWPAADDAVMPYDPGAGEIFRRESAETPLIKVIAETVDAAMAKAKEVCHPKQKYRFSSEVLGWADDYS